MGKNFFFCLLSTIYILIKFYRIGDDKITTKDILLSEINKRKLKALDELKTIQEASKNVTIADRKKYNALQSKVRKLQYELDTHKQTYGRIITTQREQLEMLNADAEMQPQTEILEVSNEPYTELIDMMCYEPCKEGVEVKHLKFTNHHKEPTYHLLKEHGEIFKDE